jgi:aminoglycoside 6'-N-acetyltransferase
MRFRFERLQREHYPLLAVWLGRPHVARWWCDDATPAGLEADYGDAIDGREAADVFIASWEGKPVGLVQRFELAAHPAYRDAIAPWTEVPPRAWSLDYLLGEPSLLRRGYGTELVGQLVRTIWADAPQASAIVVPVHVENRPSWRVLESNRFLRVSTAQLEPDNPADSPAHFVYRLESG